MHTLENSMSRKISINDLDSTINTLGSSLDIAIARGSEQEETLLIMKDLLNEIKICTSMNDYLEEELYEQDVDFFRRKNINR